MWRNKFFYYLQKGSDVLPRGVRRRWEGRREEESRTEERKRVMREGDERAEKRE